MTSYIPSSLKGFYFSIGLVYGSICKILDDRSGESLYDLESGTRVSKDDLYDLRSEIQNIIEKFCAQ